VDCDGKCKLTRTVLCIERVSGQSQWTFPWIGRGRGLSCLRCAVRCCVTRAWAIETNTLSTVHQTGGRVTVLISHGLSSTAALRCPVKIEKQTQPFGVRWFEFNVVPRMGESLCPLSRCVACLTAVIKGNRSPWRLFNRRGTLVAAKTESR